MTNNYNPSSPEDKEASVKIAALEPGIWQTNIFIPFSQVSDEELPKILRIAKKKISARYKVPVGELVYKDLVHKEVTPEGVVIRTKIRHGEADTGEPVIRFLSGKAENGAVYPDMLLYLDIFPKLPSGVNVSKGRIESIIDAEKIPRKFIDFGPLDKVLETMWQDLVPVKNIALGKGIFPEVSFDASVQYLFDWREDSSGDIVGKRRVEANTAVLKKKPMKQGEKTGKNLLGVVLEP
jgi:hypothetical protein